MKDSVFRVCLFLILASFTLCFATACEDEKPVDEKEKTEEKEKKEQKEEKKEEKKKTAKTESKKTSKKKLLKRNGVEWKENTKINSKKGAKKYKVVWGDTLSLIARTWHVDCYKLAKYNGIKNIDKIEVGQIIYNYKAK